MSDWREAAACRNVPRPDIFFPYRPSRMAADRADLETARAVCDGCPVWQQCLEDVLAVPARYDRDGVFAGLTAHERSDLRADQKAFDVRRRSMFTSAARLTTRGVVGSESPALRPDA